MARSHPTNCFGFNFSNSQLDKTSRLVSRTRCSVLHAAPQSRDPRRCTVQDGPRISSALRRKSGALRSIRGTHPHSCSNSKHEFATPRRNAPEPCIYLVPRKQRAQGTPGARCTRSPLCKGRKHRGRSHRCAGTPGIPCAMVLTAYVALSPVTGLFCHRRLRIKECPRPVGPTCLRKT
jgi:hypothetical protein